MQGVALSTLQFRNPLEEIASLRGEVSELIDRCQIAERDRDEYRQQLEAIVDREDIKSRALSNPKITHVYFRFYCAMLDRWPLILTGELIEDFSPWRLREMAGWGSEKSLTNFIQDLKAVNAILEYAPGKPTIDDQGHKECIGTIRGNPDVMPYPETFLLAETDQRKKERDAQKARDLQRSLILECVKCGSKKIKYDLVPICKECNFRHPPIMGVPVEDIHIGDIKNMTVKEDADFLPDFPDEIHTDALQVLPEEPAEVAGMYLVKSNLTSEQRAEADARTQREYEVNQAIKQIIPRPWGCSCSIRSNWVEVKGKSHCRQCEPQYRSY